LLNIKLVSVAVHFTAREKPEIWVSLILCAMAMALAYGRWVVAPL